jgi:V8-like Glu-specific endopeptidase
MRHPKSDRAAVAASAALTIIASASWAAAAPPMAAPSTAKHTTPTIHRVAVFGTDDRITLPKKRRKISRSIGLLYERRTHSVCTAFCVGDATVATAGHCLFRTKGQRAPNLSGFTFRLTTDRGSARIAGARTANAAQHITAGSTKLNIRPPIDASRDWALLRLAKPICKGAALPLARRPAGDLLKLADQKRVYHIAFHRDFLNWKLAYAGPCAIRRSFDNTAWTDISRDFTAADQLILHTCDTGGASSGSPLLIDGPSGAEVVGLNVGTYVQSRVLTQNGEVIHRYQADSVANTAVSTAPILDRLSAFKRANILPSRAKIQELQTLLRETGFFRGRLDGAYGPVTRKAIEDFERKEKRVTTGLATAALLQRLKVVRAGQHRRNVSGEMIQSIETGTLGLKKRATRRRR